MKKLNLNSTIRFKLAGDTKNNVLKNKGFLISVDHVGDCWYSTQLWVFMNLFGPAMIMGLQPAIEMEILIDERDLKATEDDENEDI